MTTTKLIEVISTICKEQNFKIDSIQVKRIVRYPTSNDKGYDDMDIIIFYYDKKKYLTGIQITFDSKSFRPDTLYLEIKR
jgi:hypothetical protein